MSDTRNARGLRVAVIRNVVRQGLLTRDDALELLNAPLSPNDPAAPVYDDREMLDWTPEQFNEWLKSEEE